MVAALMQKHYDKWISAAVARAVMTRASASPRTAVCCRRPRCPRQRHRPPCGLQYWRVQVDILLRPQPSSSLNNYELTSMLKLNADSTHFLLCVITNYTLLHMLLIPHSVSIPTALCTFFCKMWPEKKIGKRNHQKKIQCAATPTT